MSTVTEDQLSPEQLAALAEMREAEGEPEPDDDEPDDEPDEPEQEPSDVAALEALNKKLQAEAKRHENALAKLRVDDWEQHVLCPLCIGEGFLLPIPPGQQPDEIWEAIRALSGRMDTGGLKLSRYAVLCEDCDGLGMVATGARTEQGASIVCELCKAKGWYDPSDPQTFYRRMTPTQPAVAGLSVVPQQPMNQPIDGVQYQPPGGWVPGNGVGGNDDFGRWAGHPRYGIDPQFTGGTW